MEVDKQRIAELVAKIQNGDNFAFDELYKLTSERAYFVALEFTKNNQDAEDILQESYIKALSKINELDKPESFSSWLNQIVANKSKDFLKKKKPMLFSSSEEETDATEFLPDEDTSFSPEENLDQTELQKAVMEVLDELSEEKRACVLMMYFEELSVGEIAESLEIPEGTVKTRLFSARKDLKDKFAKRGITSTFSFAPIGVVIWAMRRMSDAVSKTFVTGGASAKVLAGITVAGSGAAAATTAAVAGTAATAAAATSTGATATATGIAAKIAALTVAQKVIAGVSVAAVVAGGTAGVVTVVNDDDRKDGISTTAYIEEYTTAPSFETTLAVDASATVEFSETTELSSEETASGSTLKNSTTKLQSTANSTTEKTASTSARQSTTVEQTTTRIATSTTEVQAATKVSTTKETTTRRDYSLYTSATTSATETVTTTAEETTTRPRRTTTTEAETTTRVTTTKAVTTTEEPTTEEPTTTTTTTTEATTMGKATVEIMYFTNGSSASEPTVATVSVDEGSKIDNAFVQNHMTSNFGFSRVLVESGEETDSAVADKTYSFTVHCS